MTRQATAHGTAVCSPSESEISSLPCQAKSNIERNVDITERPPGENSQNDSTLGAHELEEDTAVICYDSSLFTELVGDAEKDTSSFGACVTSSSTSLLERSGSSVVQANTKKANLNKDGCPLYSEQTGEALTETEKREEPSDKLRGRSSLPPSCSVGAHEQTQRSTSLASQTGKNEITQETVSAVGQSRDDVQRHSQNPQSDSRDVETVPEPAPPTENGPKTYQTTEDKAKQLDSANTRQKQPTSPVLLLKPPSPEVKITDGKRPAVQPSLPDDRSQESIETAPLDGDAGGPPLAIQGQIELLLRENTEETAATVAEYQKKVSDQKERRGSPGPGASDTAMDRPKGRADEDTNRGPTTSRSVGRVAPGSQAWTTAETDTSRSHGYTSNIASTTANTYDMSTRDFPTELSMTSTGTETPTYPASKKISWGKAKSYPGSETMSELEDDRSGSRTDVRQRTGTSLSTDQTRGPFRERLPPMRIPPQQQYGHSKDSRGKKPFKKESRKPRSRQDRW